MKLDSALGEEAFCYLTTVGRVTGRPHTIEIWFAREGSTVYMLSGPATAPINQHFERAFPNVHVAHQALAKACYEGGPRDPRSARLVKLGVAIGAQAEGAYVRTLVGRWPRK